MSRLRLQACLRHSKAGGPKALVLQRLPPSQLLYFCTGKASKLDTLMLMSSLMLMHHRLLRPVTVVACAVAVLHVLQQVPVVAYGAGVRRICQARARARARSLCMYVYIQTRNCMYIMQVGGVPEGVALTFPPLVRSRTTAQQPLIWRRRRSPPQYRWQSASVRLKRADRAASIFVPLYQ